jgi:cytochrome c-type protein NapB
VPHDIEGYEVSANFNKCLTCHARAATGRSQAPMVSVTHYADRSGQVLAQVSPRRYFCTQCHVSQHPDAPMVGNTFVDVDTLLATPQD